MAKIINHYQWDIKEEAIPPIDIEVRPSVPPEPPSPSLEALHLCSMLIYRQKEEALTELIHAISGELQVLKTAMKDEMAGIILHLVKNYFIEIALSKEHIAASIEALFQHIHPQHELILYLNPADYEAIRTGEFALQTPSPITIKPTNELPLGGAKLTSVGGQVCFDIERQIDDLKSTLLSLKSTTKTLGVGDV